MKWMIEQGGQDFVYDVLVASRAYIYDFSYCISFLSFLLSYGILLDQNIHRVHMIITIQYYFFAHHIPNQPPLKLSINTCLMNQQYYQQSHMQHHQLITITHIDNLDLKLQTSTIIKTALRCKICHEYETEDDKMMFLCSCKESKNKIHGHCLKESLEKKINKVINFQSEGEWVNKLKCDYCQDDFRLQYMVKRVCVSGETILKSIKKQRFIFGLCIFGILLSIAALILCSIHYTPKSTPIQQIILICSIIISSILLLFCSYKIITLFIFKKQITLSFTITPPS